MNTPFPAPHFRVVSYNMVVPGVLIKRHLWQSREGGIGYKLFRADPSHDSSLS